MTEHVFHAFPRRQMGKVNFGVILGWSVIMMTVLHWLFNMLAGPSVRLRLSQRAREMRHSHVQLPRAAGLGFLPMQLIARLLLASSCALLGRSHRAAREKHAALGVGGSCHCVVHLDCIQAAHRHCAGTRGAL